MKKPKASTPSGKGAQPATAPDLTASLMSAYFLPGWILMLPVVAALATTLRAQMQAMLLECVLGGKVEDVRVKSGAVKRVKRHLLQKKVETA